jgi:hypothetical protein
LDGLRALQHPRANAVIALFDVIAITKMRDSLTTATYVPHRRRLVLWVPALPGRAFLSLKSTIS